MPEPECIQRELCGCWELPALQMKLLTKCGQAIPCASASNPADPFGSPLRYARVDRTFDATLFENDGGVVTGSDCTKTTYVDTHPTGSGVETGPCDGPTLGCGASDTGGTGCGGEEECAPGEPTPGNSCYIDDGTSESFVYSKGINIDLIPGYALAAATWAEPGAWETWDPEQIIGGQAIGQGTATDFGFIVRRVGRRYPVHIRVTYEEEDAELNVTEYQFPFTLDGDTSEYRWEMGVFAVNTVRTVTNVEVVYGRNPGW